MYTVSLPEFLILSTGSLHFKKTRLVTEDSSAYSNGTQYLSLLLYLGGFHQRKRPLSFAAYPNSRYHITDQFLFFKKFSNNDELHCFSDFRTTLTC